MTTYSYRYNNDTLADFPDIVTALKAAGQLRNRDMAPLDMSLDLPFQFVSYLLDTAMDLLPLADVKAVAQEELTSSLIRLKSSANQASSDDEKWVFSSKNKDFHTMTALGRKRADLSRGVIRGMSSVPGGITAMMQYLFLLDENDQITAGQYTLRVGDERFTEVAMNDVPLQAQDKGINGIYIVHYLHGSGDDFLGIQYWQEQEYVGDPNIDAPVQRNNNNNYFNIVVGLGRGTTILAVHADADYAYSSLPAGHAYVPFEGSAVFASDIQDITQPGNLDARFFLTTAGGEVRHVNNNTWTQYLSVDKADPRKLTWKWNGSNSALAYFGAIDWGVDQAVYLHFEVGVRTQNSGGELEYIQIHSMDKDFLATSLRVTDSYLHQTDDVVDGIAYTYPVEFAWHCVAAGTRVTMADGSHKLIDQIRGGEELRTDAHGNTMEVRSTVEQPVMDTDTVYELRDSAGNTLLVTGDHWIALPDGYKPAAELAKGDKILTTSGTTTITSVKQVEYGGMVFSLSLGNHEKRPEIGMTGVTFAANNILVADNQLCRLQNMRRLKDPARKTAHLPPRWKAAADALLAHHHARQAHAASEPGKHGHHE